MHFSQKARLMPNGRSGSRLRGNDRIHAVLTPKKTKSANPIAANQ
jgi:hypothetical protein